MPSHPPSRIPRRHLALGTISFLLCFTAWGLVSAFAPRFRVELGLSATETAFLVAVPVLLGALARIPLGLLADRFGARVVFATLMLVVAVPTALVPVAVQYGYQVLLVAAFFLGLAGSSFAAGVAYVSGWTPAARAGTVLGIYGLGTIGQSLAVFLGPVVAARLGHAAVFQGVAALLALGGIGFAVAARNAPARGPKKSLGATLRLLATARTAWALSACYFVTFGGFVAFSVYLPSLLRDQFGLTFADAGLRTAGFVVLATALRPVGGWLADRVGGGRVLAWVFGGVIPFALLLAWPAMVPFTVGALGCAALLGLGNGAVFKLVPRYFPDDTGAVTGLVGALGGLGGFFPPLLLGVSRDRFGVVWPGFLLLAATAAAAQVLVRRVFVAEDEAASRLEPQSRVVEQLRAGMVATLATGLLVAAIVVGSRKLANFDPALVLYTFAVIFATWGVTYHYAVWLSKPPTRRYWRRGFELARRRGLVRGAVRLGGLVVTQLLAQRFIARRSRVRWATHQLLFWGCLLAVAVTFPLVFGWIHFRTPIDDQLTYVAYVFGFAVGRFAVDGSFAWLLFHVLDLAAVLVLAGLSLALLRRLRDRGAQAVQSLSMDFMPLLLLLAISVTGLALTASTTFFRGASYDFLAILHAITVIAALLSLPFGKFFHIFQRPAQLGVKLYQDAGAAGEGAACASCGERFASRLHADDLGDVLRELGFDYAIAGPAGTWQGLCPRCKRRAFAHAQLRHMAPEPPHG